MQGRVLRGVLWQAQCSLLLPMTNLGRHTHKYSTVKCRSLLRASRLMASSVGDSL